VDIAILLYQRFTALDAVGPYEVLSRLPNAQVKFVATQTGPVRTDTGALAITADYALGDVERPEIVVVPGGPGDEAAAGDAAILAWLQTAHKTTKWTTSVCTGAQLLAAAGILNGLEATTHWASYERLAVHGVTPRAERMVRQDKVITAAGVSAGIDMALEIARLEAGEEFAQAIQLGIEYDPQPPLDAGSPEKAPPHIVEMVRGFLARSG
jgi:transcriptional regulator GlxA family with amidase domain